MREGDKWGGGVCWLNWPGFNRGSLHRNHVSVFGRDAVMERIMNRTPNVERRMGRCEGF